MHFDDYLVTLLFVDCVSQLWNISLFVTHLFLSEPPR